MAIRYKEPDKSHKHRYRFYVARKDITIEELMVCCKREDKINEHAKTSTRKNMDI